MKQSALNAAADIPAQQISAVWLGELEAARRHMDRLRERAYRSRRYGIARTAADIMATLTKAMHTERRCSPST